MRDECPEMTREAAPWAAFSVTGAIYIVSCELKEVLGG